MPQYPIVPIRLRAIQKATGIALAAGHVDFLRIRNGKTLDGKNSCRCLANTGPRRFLVVESDPKKWEELTEQERRASGSKEQYIATKKDEAVAVLWYLATKAPRLLAAHQVACRSVSPGLARLDVASGVQDCASDRNRFLCLGQQFAPAFSP